MRLSIDLSLGLVDRDQEDPRVAVQYAVRLPDGKLVIYGDQSYVAYGEVLWEHPDGVIVRRINRIEYGEWVETGPDDPEAATREAMS